VLQVVESSVRLEQCVLDRVLGLVTDEPPGNRVETRKLLFGEDTESLSCESLRLGHGIGLL